MKYFAVIGLLLIIAGCGAGGEYEKAENAQDAGRQFIQASLDGDYARARFYLLKDSTNLMLLVQQQRNYQQLAPDEKRQRRESAIRPVSITSINDTATIYKYFNTYNTKDTTAMTIIKLKDDWLVDLKSILKM